MMFVTGNREDRQWKQSRKEVDFPYAIGEEEIE